MPRKSIHSSQQAVPLTLLREFRHASRLRQADVADRLGRTQATVSNVERGERRLDFVELLAWLGAPEADDIELLRVLCDRLGWHRVVDRAPRVDIVELPSPT